MPKNFDILEILFKPHPWHGLPAGELVPEVMNAYVEIVPTDTVKYEVDKSSGYLMVDRPQKYSNLCPTLYGFIPRTYCGDAVGAYCSQQTGRAGIVGDQDPLDICILSEHPISHGDILLKVRPIGGMRMIDGGAADDKIIGVLQGDAVFGGYQEISDCPEAVINRLKHYFLTYKQLPGGTQALVEITDIYDRHQAENVIKASIADYEKLYGNADERRRNLEKLLDRFT